MHGLWIGSTIAALAVGVIVWGLIFWCIIALPEAEERTSCRCRPGTTCRSSSIYTVIPFLIIAVLFYYTARDETYVDKITQEPGRDGRRDRVQVELAVHVPKAPRMSTRRASGHHDR